MSDPDPLERYGNFLDATAALHSAHDQLGAGAIDTARTIAGYFTTLIAGGMERAEAHELTLMYQHMLLHTIFDLPPCED